MMWIPDGELNWKTRLFVSTEYTNVTDRMTDRRMDGPTPHDGIGRAYALHNILMVK